MVTERKGVEDICKEFYIELFASKVDFPMLQLQHSHEKLCPVLICEVKNAVYKTKEDKARGKDGLTIKMKLEATYYGKLSPKMFRKVGKSSKNFAAQKRRI